jgi:hypothetical protein
VIGLCALILGVTFIFLAFVPRRNKRLAEGFEDLFAPTSDLSFGQWSITTFEGSVDPQVNSNFPLKPVK